jgi:hypothetical protein
VRSPTPSGVTERAVQLILGDLEGAGYLRRTKVGRRNVYAVLAGPCATRSSTGAPSTTCSTRSARRLPRRVTASRTIR